MKYISFKDKKRRNNFEGKEIEYLRLKALTCNKVLPFTMRFFFNQQLFKIGLNYSFVKIKNRCLFTQRSQSVYRLFHLNRITFRELVGQNLINGVKKSSW